MPKHQKRVIILQCRNFGDAVISSGLLESLGRCYPHWNLEIVTRPQFKEVFEYNPYVKKLHYAQFPMGTVKNFNLYEALRLTKRILILRNNKYDICINNIGDFREIFLGWLLNSKKNISIAWGKGHPYNHLIRSRLWSLVDQRITIPATVLNVYQVIEYFSQSLNCVSIGLPSLYQVDGNLYKNHQPQKVVGMHITATQPTRTWLLKKWKQLIKLVLINGYKVWLFGAPNEKYQIEQNFNELIDEYQVDLKIGALTDFFQWLTQIKVLVGLDSFSIHAAYAIATPRIMLNGANDYRIWVPPKTEVINGGNACVYIPVTISLNVKRQILNIFVCDQLL